MKFTVTKPVEIEVAFVRIIVPFRSRESGNPCRAHDHHAKRLNTGFRRHDDQYRLN